MLKIGLTGGIASGKSLVATRLEELGAVLVDADAIAREVVEPGTPGLAAVVAAFGPEILDAAGRLDRPRLGAIVFQEPERRAELNGIIHPLVRERAAAVIAAAPADTVVVQDIPLLVETGQQKNFHLVLVVDAPEDVRLRRMTEHRGMTEADARSRIAAQASRQDRLAAADAVLTNSGTRAELLASVDRLWNERLLPFARNISQGTVAARSGAAVLAAPDSDWPRQASNLAERLKAAAPEDVLAVDHIGSTAVPGLEAKDVIDLQLSVADLATADRIAPLLGAAGFPRWPGILMDSPLPGRPDPAAWSKRLHGNADPARPVNLHVRVAGSPGWWFALCFRDWLRADPAARREYGAEKRRVAALHASDATTAGYAEGKEDWFREVAAPGAQRWAESSGWQPPSYVSTGVARTAQS
ncbi:dephospho-CoA kinase [Arthrobacter sp. QXT-31]|uniref:dephospho-CoA kinase n=1 Tax=Arthrobacter sp. QXT-31 TaxID=1357915 RepID=UPI000971B2FB|nr:dephospho-CoA kinase [Arthrobacter sp. QXT-31]APX04040.1 dephospho-CoA kinase [Arthrobacter sp. QXT-31]